MRQHWMPQLLAPREDSRVAEPKRFQDPAICIAGDHAIFRADVNAYVGYHDYSQFGCPLAEREGYFAEGICPSAYVSRHVVM